MGKENTAMVQSNVEHLPTAPTPMDLMSAMIEKGVDGDQLEKMLTLQERWQANEARVAFSRAMADFQASCPTILKSKKADRYNYAPLDEIMRTIRPHLDRCGLSVRFSTKLTEQAVITAICTVTHRDGHSEVSEFAAVVDPHMKVNDTQKIGSANSYAKRYALMNALNLAASDEDDDGYSAGTEHISAEQLEKLEQIIADIETIDVPAFLKYLRVDSLDQLPAKDYQRAFKALERKAAA